MKVKVGKYVFDGEDQPVMVILSEQDKRNIAGMPEDARKYACSPDGLWSEAEFLMWIRDDGEPGSVILSESERDYLAKVMESQERLPILHSLASFLFIANKLGAKIE